MPNTSVAQSDIPPNKVCSLIRDYGVETMSAFQKGLNFTYKYYHLPALSPIPCAQNVHHTFFNLHKHVTYVPYDYQTQNQNFTMAPPSGMNYRQ